MRLHEHRPAARALVLPLAVALGALVAACANITQSAAPSAAGSAATTAAPASAGVDVASFRVYFGLGSTAGNPILAPVERTATPAPPDGGMGAALRALVAGPNAAELSASPAMFTAIPAATQVKGIQLDAGGVATVDLSPEFEETDELPALRTALAQVVFTLTQFPEVTGVQVTIGGAVLTQTDASGRDLEGAATRADYEDQMGPLLVDDPSWGARLHSPFRLAGLADVFEAQFRFRLLDADGRSLADGQLTASCGSGCLGTFGVDVPFTVTAETAAHLQVFDLSEADGSIEDVVDYPVALLP